MMISWWTWFWRSISFCGVIGAEMQLQIWIVSMVSAVCFCVPIFKLAILRSVNLSKRCPSLPCQCEGWSWNLDMALARGSLDLSRYSTLLIACNLNTGWWETTIRVLHFYITSSTIISPERIRKFLCWLVGFTLNQWESFFERDQRGSSSPFANLWIKRRFLRKRHKQVIVLISLWNFFRLSESLRFCSRSGCARRIPPSI